MPPAPRRQTGRALARCALVPAPFPMLLLLLLVVVVALLQGRPRAPAAAGPRAEHSRCLRAGPRCWAPRAHARVRLGENWGRGDSLSPLCEPCCRSSTPSPPLPLPSVLSSQQALTRAVVHGCALRFIPCALAYDPASDAGAFGAPWVPLTPSHRE